MSDDTPPTFNEQMVTKLQALLLKNPGATSISVDGTVTSFADLQARLNYFQNQVALEKQEWNQFNAISLGGFRP